MQKAHLKSCETQTKRACDWPALAVPGQTGVRFRLLCLFSTQAVGKQAGQASFSRRLEGARCDESGIDEKDSDLLQVGSVTGGKRDWLEWRCGSLRWALRGRSAVVKISQDASGFKVGRGRLSLPKRPSASTPQTSDTDATRRQTESVRIVGVVSFRRISIVLSSCAVMLRIRFLNAGRTAVLPGYLTRACIAESL